MIKKVIQRAAGKFNEIPGESVAEVEIQTRDELLTAQKSAGDFDFSKVLSIGEILDKGGSKNLEFNNPYTGKQIKVNVDDLKIPDLKQAYISCRISFYPTK